MSTADPAEGAASGPPGPPPDAPPLPSRQPPTIRRRWFWLVLGLLALSLMLNLFVAGVLTGRGGGRLGLAGLPPEIRVVVREELAAERPALVAGMRALRAARDDVRAALLAEPYDTARTEAAFARMREANERVRSVVHGALSRAAAQLPAETRATLPDRRQILRRIQRRLDQL